MLIASCAFFSMRYSLVVLVVCVVALVSARYAPTRDHNKDWLSLISGQQQLRDARIIYTLLNNDPDFMKRGRSHDQLKQGFDSNEGDFDGFQHPFFYVSHQKQHVQQREPFVFSRIGGHGNMEPEKAVVVDFPFRLGRLAEDLGEGSALAGDGVGAHLPSGVPGEV